LPVRIFMLILYPVAVPLYGVTHLLSRLFRFKRETLFDSEDELVALADLGAESGSIEPEESEMIKSVFDYGDTAVREIMVPRIDIVGIENSATMDEAIAVVKESKLSKFPVYSDNLDTINGILYAKDVLPHINGEAGTESIASLLREPYFVPESKQIASLLKEFQRRKDNVAIVVDEYGGTAGLVTVEDIVEEVVGEIQDEFDKETPMVISTGSNRWLVDARMPINDLEDELPLEFDEEREFDTLGGFFFSQFGDIPTVGTNVVLDNFRFQIRTMEGNRILKIEIFREETPDEQR
jgi:CBS domain containing-hemolysin-like protein